MIKLQIYGINDDLRPKLHSPMASYNAVLLALQLVQFIFLENISPSARDALIV